MVLDTGYMSSPLQISAQLIVTYNDTVEAYVRDDERVRVLVCISRANNNARRMAGSHFPEIPLALIVERVTQAT